MRKSSPPKSVKRIYGGGAKPTTEEAMQEPSGYDTYMRQQRQAGMLKMALIVLGVVIALLVLIFVILPIASDELF